MSSITLHMTTQRWFIQKNVHVCVEHSSSQAGERLSKKVWVRIVFLGFYLFITLAQKVHTHSERAVRLPVWLQPRLCTLHNAFNYVAVSPPVREDEMNQSPIWGRVSKQLSSFVWYLCQSTGARIPNDTGANVDRWSNNAVNKGTSYLHLSWLKSGLIGHVIGTK